MRIGVLGGTFDPPHIGHLALAKAALEQLQLDEVIWMPANRNPLKEVKPQTPAKQRLAMVQIFLKDEPKMAVADLEITRGGPSYAVDTIEELSFANPAEYWFIVGADALKSMPSWKQPERLLKACRLAVAIRPPTTPASVLARLPSHWGDKIDIIEMKPVEASATDLRDRIVRGKPTAPMLDARVLDYIRQNNLYR